MNDEDKIKKYDEIMKKKQDRKEKKKAERKSLKAKSDSLKPDRLHNELVKRLPSLVWYGTDYHIEAMDGQQKVDIVGESKSKEYYICIEVEGLRAQAINNVVKIWRYIDENPNSKPVRLIQLFSPYFYTKMGNRRRMKESIFIGKKAEQATPKIKYDWLGQEYWPFDKESKLDVLIDKISSLIA